MGNNVCLLILFTLLGTTWQLPHRISGGNDVQIQLFPSLAAVLRLNGSGELEQVCSGAILTSYYVLSAAQCINYLQIKVRVGSTYRSAGGRILDVLSVTLHDDVDLALLGLGDPIHFNVPEVGQAPMPHETLQPVVGMMAFVLGWGANEPGGALSEHLQYGVLSIISPEVCVDAYASLPSPINITDNHVCASSSLGDFCTGDVGAPLFSQGILVGIASISVDCGIGGVPGAYVKIVNFVPWIVEEVRRIPVSYSNQFLKEHSRELRRNVKLIDSF